MGRKTNILCVLVTSACLCFTSSCAKKGDDLLNMVKAGMDKDEVKKIIGVPNEVYDRKKLEQLAPSYPVCHEWTSETLECWKWRDYRLYFDKADKLQSIWWAGIMICPEELADTSRVQVQIALEPVPDTDHSNRLRVEVKAQLQHDQYIIGVLPDDLMRILVNGNDYRPFAYEAYHSLINKGILGRSILERTGDEQIILAFALDLPSGAHKIQAVWYLPTLHNDKQGWVEIKSNVVSCTMP